MPLGSKALKIVFEVGMNDAQLEFLFDLVAEDGLESPNDTDLLNDLAEWLANAQGETWIKYDNQARKVMSAFLKIGRQQSDLEWRQKFDTAVEAEVKKRIAKRKKE